MHRRQPEVEVVIQFNQLIGIDIVGLSRRVEEPAASAEVRSNALSEGGALLEVRLNALPRSRRVLQPAATGRQCIC